MTQRHPTEVALTDAHDQPASAATAARLVEHMKLTEGEALALIAAREPSEAEITEALHFNVPAIAAAFSPDVVHALSTDSKLEVGAEFVSFPDAAAHVRVLASASEKVATVNAAALTSARVEADLLQRFTYAAMPQLKARARSNSAVRHTYSPLFAYHHARHPGHHSTHAAPPATTPSTR